MGKIVQNGVNYGGVVNQASQVVSKNGKSVDDELDGIKTSLNDLIKVVIGSDITVTTNASGYASLTVPTPPTGYTLLTCGLQTWESITPVAPIEITTGGNYLLSNANVTAKIRLRYIYIKNS